MNYFVDLLFNIMTMHSSCRELSGYIIFYIMLSWNGKDLVHPVCTVRILCCAFSLFPDETFMLITSTVLQDGSKLRKKFLLHLLKYQSNEAQDNIPDIVRQYLNSINEQIYVSCLFYYRTMSNYTYLSMYTPSEVESYVFLKSLVAVFSYTCSHILY